MFWVCLCYFGVRAFYTDIVELKKPKIVACRYEKGWLNLKWKPVELATSYGVFYVKDNGEFKLIEKVHYMKPYLRKKIKLEYSRLVIKSYNYSKFCDNKIESDYSNPVIIDGKGICKIL